MKTISICGSMAFHKKMIDMKKQLERMGYTVNAPRSFEEMGIIDYDDYTQEEGEELKIEYDLIRDYYDKIVNSEAILVANFEKRNIKGYIGGATLMEMGFGFVNHKSIFMVNPIPDIQYKAEVAAMQPIVINEDLYKISKYFEALPKVFVSSDNQIKIDATSYSFRENDEYYNVIGMKIDSKVSEQPMSIDETYQGATNRLRDLKKQTTSEDYSYLVSIENGLVKLHKHHEFYNLTVCIVENDEGDKRVSIVSDVEFPKSMTDLVPHKYPDLGVFVQKEYKSELKDPFQYITKGKLKRIELLRYAIKNAIVQFNN